METDRRGFLSIATLAGTAFGGIFGVLREEREQLRSCAAGREPSVLDRIRADPANVMRLAGMDPDPWQEDVLRCGHPRILLNCSRQSGKSLTTAGLALVEALTVPNSLTLIISRASAKATNCSAR
jgi:hypothetical protein